MNDKLAVHFEATPLPGTTERSFMVMAHIADNHLRALGNIKINSADPRKAVGSFEVEPEKDPDAVIAAVRATLQKNGWNLEVKGSYTPGGYVPIDAESDA